MPFNSGGKSEVFLKFLPTECKGLFHWCIALHFFTHSDFSCLEDYLQWKKKPNWIRRAFWYNLGWKMIILPTSAFPGHLWALHKQATAPWLLCYLGVCGTCGRGLRETCSWRSLNWGRVQHPQTKGESALWPECIQSILSQCGMLTALVCCCFCLFFCLGYHNPTFPHVWYELIL